jgi:hypothetical protein
MRLLSFFLGFILVASPAFALEIKNVKTSVEGSSIIVTYDLFGKPGEKKADIKAAFTFDGERYDSNTIKIVGDSGINKPVGIGKKISWDLLKDMPAGYTGTIIVELDAQLSLSNDPFNLFGTKGKTKPPVVTEDTVADPKSKLMWVKSPLKVKPVRSVDEAIVLVGKMNVQNYLGYSDWRLPKQDEIEQLIKLASTYGYSYRQSLLPYLNKIGFNMSYDAKFWTIDKSSTEYVGDEVFVSGGTNYSRSGSSGRSTNVSSPYRSGRYTKSTDSSSSGTSSFSGNLSVKEKSGDSGLYDVIFGTSDGNYYKHNGTEQVYVMAVRGSSNSDIYAISKKIDVSIVPKQ